jgi:hypothetical protein
MVPWMWSTCSGIHDLLQEVLHQLRKEGLSVLSLGLSPLHMLREEFPHCKEVRVQLHTMQMRPGPCIVQPTVSDCEWCPVPKSK